MNIESFFKISYGLYIVSSKSEAKLSGYISNTVFQVTAEPAQFGVSCSKNNFTADLIAESKVFTISVLHKHAKAELIGLFGYKSGKNTDKFAKTNYITEKTGAPIVIDDTIAWFECKVVQTIDVGSHLLFIGQVINNELIDSEKEPLTYTYYREVKKGIAPKNAPTYINKEILKKESLKVRKYECLVCGHIYDPAVGDEDNGIPAGTNFEDLPEDWVCPVCGAQKSDFKEHS